MEYWSACILFVYDQFINCQTIVEIIECVQYKSMSYTIIIVYRFVSRGFCFAAAFGSLADVVGILRLRHFVGYVESGRIFVCEFIECLYSLCPTATFVLNVRVCAVWG